MSCMYNELRFIYNSIYESLTKDVKTYSTQYWKLVLRKLDPNAYVLEQSGVRCIAALAYLDGYFRKLGVCGSVDLLRYDTTYQDTAWRDYVYRSIGNLSMVEKRNLLRLLTESPACGAFVRNQLARG